MRVITVTDFELSRSNGQWYWHTRSPNGEIIGSGAEGYLELRSAIQGFCAQQGITQDDPSYKYLRVSAQVFRITKVAADG